MASQSDLAGWVVESLESCGGRAPIPQVAKVIWDLHESELRSSGDLFYTWQYDIRWAVNQLRRDGIVAPAKESQRGIWSLCKPN